MENKQEKTSKTPVIVSIFLVIVMFLSVAGYFVFQNPLNTLDYSKTIVELGKPVKPSAKMFNLSEDQVQTDILSLLKKHKDVVKNKNGTITTKGKKYLKAGKYSFQLKCKGIKKKVTVEVRDSSKPKFAKSVDTITISDGSQPLNLEENFATKDKSGKTTLSAFTSDVDFSKAGTYTIKVYATDGSGNKTSKKVQLVIQNDNDSLKHKNNSNAESHPDGFVNAFKDEASANAAGKKILKEGGCRAYKVVDSGFGAYRLIFRDPSDKYK